jgi:hypothetical protein
MKYKGANTTFSSKEGKTIIGLETRSRNTKMLFGSVLFPCND